MSELQLLDPEALASIDRRAFRRRRPFPWWAGPALRPAAWQRLLEHLPDPEQLEAVFGKPRRFGQQSHDRYVLDYAPELPVHPVWHQLAEELSGTVYRSFLRRQLGRRGLRLRMHWHYTPRGASVSPHCDARRKLGSHIFYFNDPAVWRPEWGGGTCILDDCGRFSHRSCPDFDDFDAEEVSPPEGNQSLLFARRGNSWHGVRALACPPEQLRRVFIVAIEAAPRWRRWLV